VERRFFVFRGLDHIGVAVLRERLLDQHRAYVRGDASVRMLHGGPLYDAAEHTIGSCLILEANSRADVEAWINSEPFTAAGIFAETTIEHWGWTYGR
jgi:uncharacterized protein